MDVDVSTPERTGAWSFGVLEFGVWGRGGSRSAPPGLPRDQVPPDTLCRTQGFSATRGTWFCRQPAFM
jgi:hypothetical protein